MGKRLSMLLVLVVGFLTVFAFTAGSGLAQTTGSSTAGSGTTVPSATRAATATTAATTAPSATTAATTAPSATTAATTTRAATSSAVATGTGGGTTGGSGAVATGTGGGTTTTTTTLPATGQAHSGSMNFVIIELIVLALAIIGTGVALKRRASHT